MSRLIAFRMVFRHQARARHRGLGKSDQRVKSANDDSGDSHLQKCDARTFPKVESRFPMDDSTLHNSTRASRPTRDDSRGRLAPRKRNLLRGRLDQRGGNSQW